MHSTARDAYLETQILTATPQRLRLMLIEGALRQARAALESWQQGRDQDGFQAVGKCRNMVAELIAGIQPDQSPLARQTLGFYLFVFSSLVESQIVKDEGRLHGILRVLEEERTTWQGVCDKFPDHPHPAAGSGAVEEVAPQRVSPAWPAPYGSPVGVAARQDSLSIEA